VSGGVFAGYARLRGGEQEVQALGGKTWFGQKVAWFDAGKLKGVRVGVIGGEVV